MSGLGFYEKYVTLMGNLKDKPDRATPYKIDYLRNIIKNEKVYKFISFDEGPNLARMKIDTLKQKKIWFSFYKTLNDETEFQINYDVKKIAKETGRSTGNVHLLINYFTEMYDVYSLTYECQDYMWKDYAANGNGICIEFNVGNYEHLYPVEYLDKESIDFNQMIISGINNGTSDMAIIPWVVKNPSNTTLNIDSTREKEVRILYCPYGFGELNGGTIEMNIKERLGYKGIAKPYEDFGLSISKIIFGDKCNGELVEELKSYLNANRIGYTFL